MRETGKEFLSLILKEERWNAGHRVVGLSLGATARWDKDLVSYKPPLIPHFSRIPFHVQSELCIVVQHCATARLLSIK